MKTPRLLSVLMLIAVIVVGMAAVGMAKDKAENKYKPAAIEGAEYIGSSACIVCHADRAPDFTKSPHSKTLQDEKAAPSTKGCEACHGPGSLHNGDPDKIVNPLLISPKDASAICLKCHTAFVTQAQWKHTRHAEVDLTCITCHQVHYAKHSPLLKKEKTETCVTCHTQQAVDYKQNSHHPIESGMMYCTSCHDVHRSKYQYMTRDEGNKLCFNCHQDKEGPFVYEHAAISGGIGKGCLECHAPHGSPNQWMLKLSGRGVCLECHSDRVTHNPGITCYAGGCHSQIHGSNSSILFIH